MVNISRHNRDNSLNGVKSPKINLAFKFLAIATAANYGATILYDSLSPARQIKISELSKFTSDLSYPNAPLLTFSRKIQVIGQIEKSFNRDYQAKQGEKPQDYRRYIEGTLVDQFEKTETKFNLTLRSYYPLPQLDLAKNKIVNLDIIANSNGWKAHGITVIK
jgi:hypothetical protein